MSRALGFIGILIVLGAGLYIYKQQVQTVAPGTSGNVRAPIDVTGVKNDLISIANVERGHLASDGKYVQLSDLIANNELTMKTPSRGQYNYSSDVSDNSFTITATWTGDPNAGVPKTITIDQTMAIKTE